MWKTWIPCENASLHTSNLLKLYLIKESCNSIQSPSRVSIQTCSSAEYWLGYLLWARRTYRNLIKNIHDKWEYWTRKDLWLLSLYHVMYMHLQCTHKKNAAPIPEDAMALDVFCMVWVIWFHRLCLCKHMCWSVTIPCHHSTARLAFYHIKLQANYAMLHK